MDQNFFFRWIWRFNALGIAALLALGVYAIVSGPFAPPFISKVDDRTTTNTGDSNRQLAMASTIEGTDIVVFSYGERVETGGGSAYPRRPAVFNYAFYNAKDGSKRWLFPDNNQVITAFEFIWEDGSAGGTTLPPAPQPLMSGRKVRAVILDVSPTAASSATRYDLYIARPDGSELTKLIDGADRVSIVTPLVPDVIVIDNQRGGRTYATTFSLVDFKQAMETEMSKDIPK